MYQNKIKAYYDYTLPFYKLFWHGNTRALHYGIWDSSTKNLKEALLNTNRFLAEKARIHPGEEVLDVGCGVGGSAFWLAKHCGVHVVGVTISERQYAKAKELSSRFHLEDRTEFYLGDYTNTSFPDESFDVVWAIESVCHALDKRVFLKEVYRLLRPDGRLVIADGFLKRKPQNNREETLLRNFFSGLALDNLAWSQVFEASITKIGFKNVENFDKTKEILPTATTLARMSRWSWPLSIVTTWLRITPRLLVDNNRAGIDQYYLIKNGIITYRVFVAEK